MYIRYTDYTHIVIELRLQLSNLQLILGVTMVRIPKHLRTTVSVSKHVTAMLSVLHGRTLATGNEMTYGELIEYMIETQYPEVHRQVMAKVKE